MSDNSSHQFAISKEDWALHRKGFDDQQRHQEKVQEAIKNNLPDLITEESIIMSMEKMSWKYQPVLLMNIKFVIIMTRISMWGRVTAIPRSGM